MKKLIALILVVLMGVSMAMAEDIDISSLSMDELVKLHDAVELELGARQSDKVMVAYSGYYVVGVDIPAGHYAITCVKSKNGYVTVKVTVGENVNTKTTNSSTNCYDGNTCTVNLQDGETLYIGDNATCIIEKMAGGLFMN